MNRKYRKQLGGKQITPRVNSINKFMRVNYM